MRIALWVLLCCCVGCGGGNAPVGGPANLTPEQEQAIMDRVNRSSGKEGKAAPPAAPNSPMP